MFAALNVKTEYSLLESVVSVEEYLAYAKQLGYQTVGICDVTMHQAFHFCRLAEAAGLQPIISFEATFLLADRQINLALLALNTQGYKALLKIATYVAEAHNKGNEVDFSQLTSLLPDLAVIVTSDTADDFLLSGLAKLTSKFYVGVDFSSDTAQSYHLPTLPFPAVYYLKKSDGELFDIVQNIKYGTNYDASVANNSEKYLSLPEVAESYFKQYFPESLGNMEKLLSGIHYDFEQSLQLPVFDKSEDSTDLLRREAEKGLAELTENDEPYKERLAHELSVIHQMGFDDYFLIVKDVLRYAAKNNIYCGMGRGSAAGSLVAYALKITHVDPIKNGLLFERFLNPERATMPDIDIDIPDNKRADMLSYMRNRWGSRYVAQIVTFSTFGKRQALRDVGKVFGLTEPEVNALTRLTAYKYGSLTDEFEKNQRFRAEILRDGLKQRIFELAKKLEGKPRQTSIHASGIVLTEKPLVNYTALAPSDSLEITQYEAKDIEALGLLKIDFLGLRNLTLIEDMRQLVKAHHQVDIDPLTIELEDDETLALFRAGNTMGIFQFENPQMRRFLRNLSPTKFDDIVTATSIFRPGPSQFIPEFIARRHGKKPVPSMDPSVDDLLVSTYGIMIYQEQVMLVAVRFAGFSMGRADSLRRAISKKKGDEFEKLQQEFINGAVQQGHSAEKATEIYELIVRFANYGFNRSHAVAYAALAVQISYYKAHYPDEFYEIHLRGYKREVMLRDALDNAYSVKVPDINSMPYHDKVADKKIALGLAHISGFPRDYALWIIENRPFTSFEDFVKRTPESFQKVDLIDRLIKIGLFDRLEVNRRKLSVNLPKLIEFNQTFQLDLFGSVKLQFAYEEAEDFSSTEKYETERELLGIAVTPHPLANWKKKLAGNYTELSELTVSQQCKILVEVLQIRQLTTKNKERMAFLEVTDGHNPLTVVIFPEVYRQVLAQQSLARGKMYLITGRAVLRDEAIQLQASRFVEISESKERLWLSIADDSQNNRLAQVLDRFVGPISVALHDESSNQTREIGRYVEHSDALLKQLSGLTKKAIYR